MEPYFVVVLAWGPATRGGLRLVWLHFRLQRCRPISSSQALTRLRFALTEDWPTIKPYREDRWAELGDARQAAIAPSLDLLAGLHTRWVALLAGLEAQEWKRGYLHPESGRQSVEQVLALYDWHSRHHLAHVTNLRDRLHW